MKPSWATKKSQQKGPREPETSSTKLSGPRLIIFIIGGMSYSEMKTCHKLAAEFGREIIIGIYNYILIISRLNSCLNSGINHGYSQRFT
jgi:hypothetical protein